MHRNTENCSLIHCVSIRTTLIARPPVAVFDHQILYRNRLEVILVLLSGSLSIHKEQIHSTYHSLIIRQPNHPVKSVVAKVKKKLAANSNSYFGRYGASFFLAQEP